MAEFWVRVRTGLPLDHQASVRCHSFGCCDHHYWRVLACCARDVSRDHADIASQLVRELVRHSVMLPTTNAQTMVEGMAERWQVFQK
jgi:hypothetical protein